MKFEGESLYVIENNIAEGSDEAIEHRTVLVPSTSTIYIFQCLNSLTLVDCLAGSNINHCQIVVRR